MPVLCSTLLQAGDLAAPTVAKFIRVIASSGGGKAACRDRDVAAELATLGVAVDPESKVVWVSLEAEVGKLARMGRLVICGKLELLAAGASVALVAEGGRPTIYISAKNLAGTGVALSDSVLKISKVVK
jgi:hypothetical protein